MHPAGGRRAGAGHGAVLFAAAAGAPAAPARFHPDEPPHPGGGEAAVGTWGRSGPCSPGRCPWRRLRRSTRPAPSSWRALSTGRCACPFRGSACSAPCWEAAAATGACAPSPAACPLPRRGHRPRPLSKGFVLCPGNWTVKTGGGVLRQNRGADEAAGVRGGRCFRLPPRRRWGGGAPGPAGPAGGRVLPLRVYPGVSHRGAGPRHVRRAPEGGRDPGHREGVRLPAGAVPGGEPAGVRFSGLKSAGGGIAPHRPGWGRPPGCLHRAFGGGPLPAAPGAVRPAAAKDRGYAFPRGERSSAPGRGALRRVHPQRPAAGGLGHLAAPAGTAGAHPLPEDAAVLFRPFLPAGGAALAGPIPAGFPGVLPGEEVPGNRAAPGDAAGPAGAPAGAGVSVRFSGHSPGAVRGGKSDSPKNGTVRPGGL